MRVDRYGFGFVVINGRTYRSDVIVLPDRVLPWWRQRGHEVVKEDLKEALRVIPEVLVVGTGAYGALKLDPQVKAYLDELGVELLVLPTNQACQRYNQLQALGKQVVAALHLTC
ncbi:Mth938-like domain-containing protein [Desulfothermobacter acidiphilus]|uniref:Mth938-like domain-containing protein n=1 Tax=Desulfothermobacter acidiphilus TaxID=1938353 RepID=UPI003F8B0A17